jgi:hypothetical protein
VEVQLQTFLTLATDKDVISFMAQQLYSRKRAPSIHWIEGWTNPRADTDTGEKRKTSCPARNQTDSAAIQHSA